MSSRDPTAAPIPPDLPADPGQPDASPDRPNDDGAKLPYRRPRLVREGRVEEKTLQGFFGTFSP